MNSTAMTTAVARLSRRMISPSIPRVATGFRALYLHCNTALFTRRRLTPLPGGERRGEGRNSESSESRIRPHDLLEHARRIALQTGCILGRPLNLRSRDRRYSLAILHTSLAESILLEPVLRSIAERYPENPLHLWAPREVCHLYRAAPYIERLRIIGPNSQNELPQLLTSVRFGFRLGRRSYKQIFCDSLPAGLTVDDLARTSRATVVAPFEREDLADPCTEAPRVYSHDTSAQLAYSRARAWRNEAATLGAATIAAIVPCAHPHDITIGLGTWASLIREMWLKHKTLPILFPEGNDNPALEQLSSLLNEIPHARLDADVELLERAGLLARVDLVLAAAGSSAQLALAQETSTIIIGSAPRRSLYAWAGKLLTWLTPDEAGRLDRAEILRACRKATPKMPRTRVA